MPRLSKAQLATMTPQEVLRYHVSGAIARGEGAAIVCQPAPHVAVYNALDRASAALQTFPRAPNGLTPDAVKVSPAYRTAKAEYARAFQAVRHFNRTKGE